MLTEKDREELQHRSQEFVRIFNENDGERLSQLYTDDAELLAPGLLRLTGRKAAAKFWQSAFAAGTRRFEKIEPVLLRGDGTVAYEYANWLLSVTEKSGQVTKATGKNLLVWQKTGEEWLIQLDIWNTP